MVETVKDIGAVPWSDDDLRAALHPFLNDYRDRPTRSKVAEMKSVHYFFLWFVLRHLRPTHVIESGVWKGQSTWLIEKAVPDASIFAIEPDLHRVEYRSPNAVYLDTDFSRADWSGIDRDRTVVFLDDHQNALRRLQECRWLGFRHIVFDDNYPIGRGDHYSLRSILGGAGFKTSLWPPRMNGYYVRLALERFLYGGFWRIDPNLHDRKALLENIAVYYEFPPVFRTETTRWGGPWDDDYDPAKPALLPDGKAQEFPELHDDAKAYTCFAYVELKKAAGQS